MRFPLLALLLLARFLTGYCQSNGNEPCHCDQDLTFVANYVENHYSGFQDNVTNENRAAYEDLKTRLLIKSKEPLSKIQCFLVLKEFQSFFRDRHLQMAFAARAVSNAEINEKSNKEIAKFKAGPLFIGSERITFDSVTTWSQLSHSDDELEGIYENDVYQIAVIQNKTSWRDYYGVITRSKTSLWEKGQVKMEIKRVSDAVYYVTTYSRNHSLGFRTVEYDNPITAASDFKKVYPLKSVAGAKPNFSASPSGKWLQFKELNDSTCYIHIKSFNGALRKKFDSAYKKILPLIEKKPNLLIDIRDNGGGSDGCWSALEKRFYSRPYPLEIGEVYCTSETIKRHEEWLASMSPNTHGWITIKYFKFRIKKMKKAVPGSFLPLREIAPWYAKSFVSPSVNSHSKVYTMPKKVIVMYNRKSGSAAEGLILSAMHSTKVLTFGENSVGCITFGDLLPVNTPSGFVLYAGTNRTKSRFQYEKVGIPPQVLANDQQDWVEQTNQLWKLIK